MKLMTGNVLIDDTRENEDDETLQEPGALLLDLLSDQVESQRETNEMISSLIQVVDRLIHHVSEVTDQLEISRHYSGLTTYLGKRTWQ
jgi:hypothetical protein